MSPVWLHFDAKYRLSDVGLARELAGDEEEETSEPVRDDLLKMHVYRDAIRRSVGSFVLYPGPVEASPPYQVYHELLPGVGAFALRPGESIELRTSPLAEFLDAVLSHVASVATQDRRHRYWQGISFQEATPPREFGWEPIEGLPPADTKVLLGFVRSDAHMRWISATHLYNLRADAGRDGAVTIDAPEVGADVLLLYDAQGVRDVWLLSGLAELRTSDQVRLLGYPNPRGSYICLKLGQRLSSPSLPEIGRPQLESLLASLGSRFTVPTVTTWSTLSESVSTG
jgi:hypothetical protein